jgi:hypothetical protein
MSRGTVSERSEDGRIARLTGTVTQGGVVPVEVESIAGSLADGDDTRMTWFVVTYSDGDEEHRHGTLTEASELASTHGLVVVPSPGRSFKWVRDPGAWRPSHRAAP